MFWLRTCESKEKWEKSWELSFLPPLRRFKCLTTLSSPFFPLSSTFEIRSRISDMIIVKIRRGGSMNIVTCNTAKSSLNPHRVGFRTKLRKKGKGMREKRNWKFDRKERINVTKFLERKKILWEKRKWERKKEKESFGNTHQVQSGSSLLSLLFYLFVCFLLLFKIFQKILLLTLKVILNNSSFLETVISSRMDLQEIKSQRWMTRRIFLLLRGFTSRLRQ